MIEFLNLPESHAEADLHKELLRKLKNFLIELGHDFCFIGSEYPLQVGNRDFALDLLFFHHGLYLLPFKMLGHHFHILNYVRYTPQTVQDARF